MRTTRTRTAGVLSLCGVGLALTMACGVADDSSSPAESGEESVTAESGEETGTAKQNLFGGIEFVTSGETCTPLERAAVKDLALYGRTAVSSDAFDKCVNTRIDRNWFKSCNTVDPAAGQSKADRVQALLNVARSALPGKVACGSTPGSSYGIALHPEELVRRDGYEDLTLWLNPTVLDEVLAGESQPSLAGLLFHEAAHTLGYLDDSNGCGIGMPYLLQFCIMDILNASANLCSDACTSGGQIGIVSAAQVTFPDLAAAETGSGECHCIRDPGIPGNTSVDAPPHPTIGANEVGDAYGSSVVFGDFNGDGLKDAAVGAPGESWGEVSAGAVYVYEATTAGLYPVKRLGQTTGSLSTNVAGDQYGYALAAGDLNKDGFTDLAVGAPGKSSGSGRVFLYRGSVNGLEPVRVLSQSGLGDNEAGDNFGFALAVRYGGLRSSLLVGAPEEVFNGARSGYVFSFTGALDATQLVTPGFGINQSDLDANEDGDLFGYAITTGHINNDNVADVVIGAPGENDSLGRAYVYYSSDISPYTANTERELFAPAGSFMFGNALTIGSFTNNQWGQVAVGNFGFTGNALLQGAVHVFDAHAIIPEPANRLRYSYIGTRANALAGYSLATMYSSGRTYDNLAVGAPGGSGTVHILEGKSGSMTVRQNLDQGPLGGEEAEDRTGWALASGRVIADGSDDLLVGIPGEGPGSAPDTSGGAMLLRGEAQATGGPLLVHHRFHTQED